MDFFVYWSCVLHLCWTYLLLLIVCVSVHVCVHLDSLAFSICKDVSSKDRDIFRSSFLIWMPFLSFSFLLAVARTSRTMLTAKGKQTFYLVISPLDRRGKGFGQYTCDVICRFSHMLPTRFSSCSSISSLLFVFIINTVDFIEYFIEMIVCVCLYLLIGCIMLICFLNVKSILHSLGNPTCGHSHCWDFGEDFCVYMHKECWSRDVFAWF